jgi:predicted DNA-binding protein with PD1-like motif
MNVSKENGMRTSIHRTPVGIIVAALTITACGNSGNDGQTTDGPPTTTTTATVQSARETSTIVVRLSEGDDVFAKLAEVVQTYDIKSGLVLTGIGQWKTFTLGLYDVSQQKLVTTAYQGPLELASMHGSIAHAADGTLKLHIHAALGDETNKTVAGHVSSATVSILNEIVVQKLGSIELFSTQNPANGAWELDIGGAADGGP